MSNQDSNGAKPELKAISAAHRRLRAAARKKADEFSGTEVVKLLDDARELNGALNDRVSEIHRLEKERAREIESFEARIKAAQTHAENLEAEKRDLTHQLGLKEQELEALQPISDSFDEALEAETEKLTAQIEKLKEQNGDFKVKAKEAERVRDEAVAERDKTREELLNTQRELAEANTAVGKAAQLKEENAYLVGELETARITLTKTLEELAGKTRENEQLARSRDAEAERCGEISQQLEAKRNSFDDYKTKAERMLAELKTDKIHLEQAVESGNTEIRGLKDSVEREASRAADNAAKFESERKRADELADKLIDADNKVSDLESRIRELESESATWQDRCESADKRVNELMDLVKLEETKALDLHEALRAAREELLETEKPEAANRRLDGIRKERDDAKGELVESRRRLRELETELAQVKRDKSSAESKIRSIEARVESTRRDLEKAQIELSDSRAEASNAKKDAVAAKRRLSVTRRLVEDQKAQIIRLEQL